MMCEDIKFYIFMLFFIEIAIIISVIDVFIDRCKFRSGIMKVKDIIEIIEQNEDFKTRIKNYKSRPETQNIGEVLEHTYKQWLESELENE